MHKYVPFNVVCGGSGAIKGEGAKGSDGGFNEGPGHALPTCENLINGGKGLAFSEEPSHRKDGVLHDEVTASVGGAHSKGNPDGKATEHAGGKVRTSGGAASRRRDPLGKDGVWEASKDSKVTDEVSIKVDMEGVPVGGHDSGATEGANTEAKRLLPVVEPPRATLMNSEGNLKVWELESVTQASSNIISHGSSNVCDSANTRRRWDGDAFQLNHAGGSIRTG